MATRSQSTKLFRTNGTQKSIQMLSDQSRSGARLCQTPCISFHSQNCCNKSSYSPDNPGFLADKDGRILFNPRKNAFPWSNYLRDKWFGEKACGKRHVKPNLDNIPRFYKKPEPMCKVECHCEVSPEQEPEIDSELPLIEQNMIRGLHRLRKYRPPVIWILGHPHEPILVSRELFCKDLALSLGFQYINIDNEIRTIFESLPQTDKVTLDKDREVQTETNTTTSLAFERKTGRVSYRLVKNGEKKDVRLNLNGILEMLKLAMTEQECAKGFVIDSFPCNEIEAIAFEAMFYPITFAVYIVPTGCGEGEDDYACDDDDDDLDFDVVRPTYFRRTCQYSEKEVESLSKKYRHRCLILPNSKSLGCEEIELANALILMKLMKQVDAKPEDIGDGYPPLLPPCKNVQCDCGCFDSFDQNPKLEKQLKILTEIQDIIRKEQEASWLKKTSCGNTDDMAQMSDGFFCTSFVAPTKVIRDPPEPDYSGYVNNDVSDHQLQRKDSDTESHLTYTVNKDTELPDESNNKYKDEYVVLEDPAIADDLVHDFGDGRYVPSTTLGGSLESKSVDDEDEPQQPDESDSDDESRESDGDEVEED